MSIEYSQAIQSFSANYGINHPDDLLMKLGGFIEEKTTTSLKDVIKEKNFPLILTEVFLWLAKADEKFMFIHGSLSVDNIFVTKNNKERTISVGLQTYHLSSPFSPKIYIDNSKMLLAYLGIPLVENNVYAPGMDLYNLLSSIIQYAPEFTWMMDYINNGMNNTHPMYKKSILHFVLWVQTMKPEYFNTTERVPNIKPLAKANVNIDSAIISLFFGGPITPQKIMYDKQCMINYEKIKIGMMIIDPEKRLDINFPSTSSLQSVFNSFYAIHSACKLIQIYDSVISANSAFKSELKELDKSMDTLKINIYSLYLRMKRFISYSNYSLMTQIRNVSKRTGYSLVILDNENNTLSNLYEPDGMIKYIVKYFNIEREAMQGINVNSLYFSPASLQQIMRTRNVVPKELYILISKHIHAKEALKIVETKNNDIEIYTNLRQYVTRDHDFDRGAARVRDLTELLLNTSLWKDYTQTHTDIRYLDFGGNDGSISVSIAEHLKIKKDNAYSADIGVWFDRVQQRKYDQITFLNLRINYPIPLPDKSIDLITVFQVLHHVENLEYTLRELFRICKKFLIIREHDCRNNADKMLIDIEHCLYEATIEEKENIQFLNNYSADYKSITEWDTLLTNVGFKKVNTKITVRGPTRYYYRLYMI